MKKTLFLALTVVLVCLLAVGVSAAEPSYKDGEWIYAADGTTKLAIRDTEGNPLVWYMNGEELKWMRADQTDETQSVYIKYSISAGGSGFDSNVLTPQKTLKDIDIYDNGTHIECSGINSALVLFNMERIDTDAINGWLWGNKNGCCLLMRGIVFPSTLKGIGQEGFTNHRVVQMWNLENTQLMYIHTYFSAPFGNSTLTQEATNYTIKFPSTLTVLPVVQNSRVKTVIFSPNTVSQNTNRTIGDMPNIEKIFIPAAMAEVGFNAETFRSSTNFVLFFTGTKEQAEQLKAKSNTAHQTHFTTNAQLVSFEDYLADSATYDNAKVITIVYDTNECYAFYDNTHSGEAINGCQVVCSNCGNTEMAENPVHNSTLEIAKGENGFFSEIVVSSTCKDCKTVVSENTIDPIFTARGYSNGGAGDVYGMTQKFLINKDALNDYELYTGIKLEYGVLAAAGANSVSPLVVNDGVVSAVNNKVIFSKFTGGEYDYFDIKIANIDAGNLDTSIAMNAYVFDGTNLYYLDDGVTSNTAVSVTYNTVTVALVPSKEEE